MKRRNPDEGTHSTAHAASTLAGVVGHELNNIAVPLLGFAELAVQQAGASESLGPILDEIKIAVARIKSLAADLEILGETASHVVAVAIGDCMPVASGAGPTSPGVDWSCSASTLVEVDREHARRALQALADITRRPRAQAASMSDWRVAQEAPGAARCAACGTALQRNDYVVVQVFSSRTIPSEALSDPFGSARVVRANRRLGLAVLVHSTHGAGGHIFLNPRSGTVSLAFPLA
jgi:hypothetical protein